MADFIVISGRILQLLFHGVAIIAGEIAHPQLLLIYRRQPVPRQPALIGNVDAAIDFSDVFVFCLRDEGGLVFADIEVPIIIRSAALLPFSTAGRNPINLFYTMRQRLAREPTTLLQFALIPPVPAEPLLNIDERAFPAEHLPLVTIRVGEIRHVIPNLRRPDNALTPRVGIGAAHLLIYLREMSETYRDKWGDRYRLGLSDAALELQIASNGQWVRFILGNVVHTLGAYEFFLEARAGEHFHLWETSFNFQRFYSVVLHAATHLCLLQPNFCVWVAREAMWFEHYSSRQSFFLYSLP